MIEISAIGPKLLEDGFACAGAAAERARTSKTGGTKAAAGGFAFPGGGVSFPSGGGSGRSGGIGIVGILIILALMWFFGIDPTVLMQGGGPGRR